MKKILSILSIILLIIFTLSITVNAASFSATMTPSSSVVKEAEEFTVTVKVSSLDVGTNGINALNGYLKYDNDIFETISESSIEGLNSWKSKYDSSNGKIELTKSSFVNSTQEVFQITFKTKEGVTGKNGIISFSKIVASNSESDILATDISTSISIGEVEVSNNTTNITNNTNTVSLTPVNTVEKASNNTLTINTINATNNNTSNNSVSSYVNTMTNTTVESNMPKTGVDDTLIFLMLGTIAVAIIFYVKIEKLN